MNLVCLFICFFFFLLRRNSRWPPTVAGKGFLQKVASKLCRYPVGQKFHRNRSILLCFRDKCIFVFNTEIQDGHQEWWENFFLRVKNFVEIALSRSVSEINMFLHFTQKFKLVGKIHTLRFRDKHVFAFYAEIQAGRQKWWGNDF